MSLESDGHSLEPPVKDTLERYHVGHDQFGVGSRGASSRHWKGRRSNFWDREAVRGMEIETIDSIVALRRGIPKTHFELKATRFWSAPAERSGDGALD
ncbi:MAG: hypothetical protein ACRD6N_19365, partial [Pyrinomonadaceae bacterium]